MVAMEEAPQALMEGALALTPEGEEGAVMEGHQGDTVVRREVAAMGANQIACPTWGLVLERSIGIWLHSPSLKRTSIKSTLM